MSDTTPLAQPPKCPAVSADTVTMGPPVLPIERIRLFSDRQWEEFVLEWANGLRSKYARVEKCGGAGDMGRDVIAFPEGAVSKCLYLLQSCSIGPYFTVLSLNITDIRLKTGKI